MDVGTGILFLWERNEENSWNPDLAAELRALGASVTEVHALDSLRPLDLDDFDVCLPRFRAGAANMACLDDLVVRAGVPMVNSRWTRITCENKALAHLAFEERGIKQPHWLTVSA